MRLILNAIRTLSSAQLYTKKSRKRQEIFFNQVLAFDEIDRLLDPKALSHFSRYTQNGKQPVGTLKRHSDGTLAENLIIKGNNLVALHTLLVTKFKGKVKLIYIDVPFNTENDSFAYNDKFNRSTWLTFMKNRIEVAKTLLADNGVIFVHCDYNEDGYLRVLLDEIFTEDNFVANIAVRSSTPSGTKTVHKDKKIIKQKDTILVYKNGSIKLNPQYIARTEWDSHYSRFITKKNNEYILADVIDILKNEGVIFNSFQELNPTKENIRKFLEKYKDNICTLQSHKNKDADKISRERFKDKIYEHKINGITEGLYFNGRVVSTISSSINDILYRKQMKKYWGILLCDFWEDIDFQNTQNEGGISFPTGKKPEALLHRIIDMTTQEGDIVLDYHLGSGTTAAVAHKMNRQYIGIEQMDYIETLAVERLKKVIDGEQSGISKAVNWQGGGEFVYFELAAFNENAKDLILACEDFDSLKTLFNELCSRYFLKYTLSIKEFADIMQEAEFQALSLDEQKQMMLEMLDLNQLYVNVSDMEDSQFDDVLSDEDKNLTLQFYGEQ